MCYYLFINFILTDSFGNEYENNDKNCVFKRADFKQ